MTWRIRRAVATGLPSSLTATIPASFIAAISARASPLLPTEAAPIGQTRTLPAAAARSTMERVTEALSFTGCVFGMQQTAVNPPRAAERVPVSMVSDISWPGSRRWQCRSMKPGATMRPVASNVSASGADRLAPILAMRAPSSSTSFVASVFVAGSSTRPFLISNIRSFLPGTSFASSDLGRWRRFHSRAADEMVKQGHAYGEAVGDLFEHAGLRAVGNRAINFQAANHGPGMQHQRAGPRELQALRRELVAQNIFLGGERGFVQALGLHAQGDDHVRAVESFFDARNAANVGRQSFQFARHPHRGTTQSDAYAKFAEQVNIGSRHAAVQHVAEDGEIPAFELALAVADGERIEQRLGGMLMRAVAGVDDGNTEAVGNKFRRAGRTMADDDAVGAHGFERAHGVEKRFAFFQAGCFGLEIHGVRAQSGRSGGEADARARGIFEEGECDSLAAQGGQFFQRMTLKFLERLGLIENK